MSTVKTLSEFNDLTLDFGKDYVFSDLTTRGLSAFNNLVSFENSGDYDSLVFTLRQEGNGTRIDFCYGYGFNERCTLRINGNPYDGCSYQGVDYYKIGFAVASLLDALDSFYEGTEIAGDYYYLQKSMVLTLCKAFGIS